MEKPCLLVFVDNLFFQTQIEGIARGKGIDVYFATRGEQLSQLAKTIAPLMMIVDLSGLDSEWIFRHISEVGFANPGLPIIAFISHVQEDVRARAERYGCRTIFTKSELKKKLPETIEKVLRKSL